MTAGFLVGALAARSTGIEPPAFRLRTVRLLAERFAIEIEAEMGNLERVFSDYSQEHEWSVRPSAPCDAVHDGSARSRPYDHSSVR